MPKRSTALLLGLLCITSAQAADDCPLLPTPVIAEQFGYSQAIDVRYREKRHLSCTFTWKAATQGVQTVAGKEVRFQQENRITITRAEMRTEKDWERVLKPYAQHQPVSIDGLGDRAVWSDSLKQVSLMQGLQVIHVAVDAPDATSSNRDNAIALARKLLARAGK